MFGSDNNSTKPVKLGGVTVSTSSQGIAITKGWGTFRTNINLLWYGNFKSKAIKNSGGGKGGGGHTTGYTYTAALIAGICAGPVTALKSIWIDQTQYSNTATGWAAITSAGVTTSGTGTDLAQAGFSAALGALGQAVWSWLTTFNPAQAIGYSGIAYLYANNFALDSSGAMPGLGIEVQTTHTVGALPDANPSDILTDFLTNTKDGLPGWPSASIGSLTQYSNYCLAANLLLSPCLDTAVTASQFIDDLMTATNSVVFWSEGLLKVTPLGDVSLTGNSTTFTPNLTPVYAVTDHDYVTAGRQTEPVVVDLSDQVNAYNYVQVEWLDRTNAYNTSIATAQDDANISQFLLRKQDPITLHAICDPVVAQNITQLILQGTLYVRGQYKFVLPWSYAILEPTDLLSINDAGLGLSNFLVRIDQIDDDQDTVRTITAEEVPIGPGSAPAYANQATISYIGDRSIDPGSIEANLLEWSEDFTQAAWVATDCTFTGGQTDPNGGTTANAMVCGGAGNSFVIQNVTMNGAGANFTFSVWIKAGTLSGNVQVGFMDGSFGNRIFADVTPTAGWTQVVVSGFMPTGAATNVYAFIDPDNNAGTSGQTLLLWGAQLEVGVIAGPYARTTSALAGPVIFNPPSVLSSQAAVWAAVAGNANWGGCNVWRSVNGTDYDQIGTITGGSTFGVLAEDFGANLLDWSQDFTQVATWNPQNSTIGTGITDPFGHTTANSIITNGGNNYVFQTITEACAGRTYTGSVWLKAGTLGGSVWFVLKDGAGTPIGAGTTVTPGAGWIRYSFTCIAPSGAVANPTLFIDPSLSGSSGQTTLVFGAQLEHGPTMTPYDPTLAVPFLTDPDQTNTLAVDLRPSAGALANASTAAADNGGSMCLVDSELVCFSTATLVGTSQYDLTTYLRRGYLNSVPTNHLMGAPFVRLDSNIFDFPYFATNVGQTIFVKFQSFNAWGANVQSLANCIAYPIMPIPLGSAPPVSTAWTAVGGTVSNAGVAQPALLITGASDNASATAVIFSYRITGETQWSSAGQHPTSTVSYPLTNGIASGQTYDVGVSYLVNGVPSAVQVIASGITAGAASTGYTPGSTITSVTSPTGAGSLTLPAGPYTHVDIVITGIGGAGYGGVGPYGGSAHGGSAGSTAVYHNLAVTPGTTVINWNLSGAVGTATTATCSSPSMSLSAPSGINATSSASAAAPAAATGGTTNYAGHAGGLTNSWSGGGAADINGVYTDQNTINSAGNAPGGGGSGYVALGGAANILIIARA